MVCNVSFTSEPRAKISNAAMLSGDKYEDEMFRLIQASRPFQHHNLLHCLQRHTKPPFDVIERGYVNTVASCDVIYDVIIRV